MGGNVTPWNSTKLYEEQSPIFNATEIRAPFMILQGTADGAVDWIEGLRYVNAAPLQRQAVSAGRPVDVTRVQPNSP